MIGDGALERAYARGFLVPDAPPVPPLCLKVDWPVRPLARLPDARLVLGARIGAAGRPAGRLGPVFDHDGRLLAFSAGHVFTAAGELVYRGDQAVGRVLALARPRQGLASVDAALIELAAEVVGTPGGAVQRPGWRAPVRGDVVRLAVQGARACGRLGATSVTARMKDGPNEFLLVRQLAVTGLRFSVAGDSGAALVDTDGEYLGLLVGRQGGVAIATPGAELFAAFGLNAWFPGPAERIVTALGAPP